MPGGRDGSCSARQRRKLAEIDDAIELDTSCIEARNSHDLFGLQFVGVRCRRCSLGVASSSSWAGPGFCGTPAVVSAVGEDHLTPATHSTAATQKHDILSY